MKSFIFNALVWLNRPTIQAAVVGLAFIFVISVSYALELIVVDDPQCYYCNKFKEGAAQSYEQSEHADWAPLKYVIYSRGYQPVQSEWPDWFLLAMDDGRIKPITGTPTFIFYDSVKGEDEPREIGRMVGYGDEALFYANMEHYHKQYIEWKKTQ